MNFRPRLKVLSDDQIYDIHQAALEILWNTGVLVKAPEARVPAGKGRRSRGQGDDGLLDPGLHC